MINGCESSGSTDKQTQVSFRFLRHEYIRFLASGALVGMVCVLLREAIASVMNDSLWEYSISVVIVYIFGFFLSYFFQSIFVFQHRRSSWRPKHLASFLLVAGSCALAASFLSTTFRYGFGMDHMIGRLAPTISFVLGALAVSVFNYIFTKRLVFDPILVEMHDNEQGQGR